VYGLVALQKVVVTTFESGRHPKSGAWRDSAGLVTQRRHPLQREASSSTTYWSIIEMILVDRPCAMGV